MRDLFEVDAADSGHPRLTMSALEAAYELGCSEKFLLQIARQGKIASVVIARHIRFTRAQLEAYLEAQARPLAVIAPRVRRRRGSLPNC